MAAISKYLTAKNSSIAGGVLLLLYVLKQRRRASQLNCKKGSALVQKNDKEGKKERAAVDKLFFLRIYRILRIMTPRFLCMEVEWFPMFLSWLFLSLHS